MSTQEFLYGCDPEVFLKAGNEFISASGLFPGTKEHPYEVEKGAIQVDGLALEFNIQPAKTPTEFDKNIETVLTQMREMVSKVDKDLKINFTPIAKFNINYFTEKIPETAKILGCDPDFSAITGEVIEMKEDISNKPIRTAAGHIHIGWTKDEDPTNSVHFNDARFVANHFRQYGSMIPGQQYTSDEALRLKYYGHSGAFRPKSYGVELRQYSNRWVEHSMTRLSAFNFIDKHIKQLYRG